MNTRTTLFALAGLTLATSASAGVLGANATNTNTAQGVVNVLTADTDTDWTQAQLLLNLTSGTLYQDAFGENTSPNSAFFSLAPTLANDTFVSAGDLYDDTPSVAGGALNLGGAVTQTMSTTSIDITWFDTDTSDIGTSTIAQITASADAQGTFELLVYSAGDSSGTLFEGNVNNGVVSVVPEPTSLALLSLGGLLVARRRRG